MAQNNNGNNIGGSNSFTERNKVMVTICIWQFFLGVERTIILSTLWLYLYERFSKVDAENYYGATLAAFNVSVFIVSPIFGFLSGYLKISVKKLLIASNILEIIGNVVYFAAGRPWVVLIGRAIAGIGGGAEVPLYADLVRCTSEAERTGVIIILLASRHFGLIIGPAFTLVVSNVTLDIANRHFNVYNFPGLLMAGLWVFHTIFACFVYPSVKHSISDESGAVTLVNKQCSMPIDVNELSCRLLYDDSEVSIKDSRYFEVPHKLNKFDNDNKKERYPKACGYPSLFQEYVSKFLESNCNLSRYMNWAIFTMLVTVFSLYISVMGLEAVLPPVAQRYFHWSEVEVSYIYVGCGAFIIVGYLILRCLSKHLTDRSLLGIGILVLVLDYAALGVCLIFVSDDRVALFATLIISLVVLHVVGIQLCIASTESLFSKLSPTEDAERAQTIFRTVVNFSFLIGPYLGGTLQFVAYLVMFIMSFLMALSGFSFLFAYSKLNPSNQAKTIPKQNLEN